MEICRSDCSGIPVTRAVWRAPQDMVFTLTFSKLGQSSSLGRVCTIIQVNNYKLISHITSVGCLRGTSAWSEPVPSCPNWFPPNAYTSPSADVQTVCHRPAATTSIRIPNKEDTQVGLSSSSVLPCPHFSKTRWHYFSITSISMLQPREWSKR